jgi:amino acid transporter
MHHQTKGAAFRQGIVVALILALLTVIEYYVALALPSAALLFLLALVKSALVVYFFMHISRVWSSNQGGH